MKEEIKIKIYSKFNDFYDHVGFYSKDDRVWVRKTQTLNLSSSSSKLDLLSKKLKDFLIEAVNTKPSPNTSHIDYDMDYTIVVGFCGKLYLCILSHKKICCVTELHKAYDNYTEYTANQKTKIGIKFRWSLNYLFSEKGFNDWKSQYSNHPNLRQIFSDINSPVFLLRRSNNKIILTINPCLKDYKLQNVFHPFMAHQEIDMYLGNELANSEDKTLERSQELIRDSKGFNDWSFKQQGPKKRKRRK